MPVSMVLDTGPMEPTPTLMPTTARGPLRPSPRPRLTPLFCMAPTAMVPAPTTAMEDTEPMEPTPTPIYYGKRSAEAEPEAEADPAVLYSTAHVAAPLTTAYTHAVAAPLTYTTHVGQPVTYTAAVAPVVGAATALKTVVPTVASTVYSHAYPYVYGKRSADAEADPALLYTAGVAPLAYTHHAVAAPAVAAYTVPVATVHKAPAHGVAATYAGLVHSSHVGVCLNNVGVQVPC